MPLLKLKFFLLFLIFFLLTDDRSVGAESLLQKYLKHLNKYISQVLNTATDIACRSSKHFCTVSNILKCNGIGILFSNVGIFTNFEDHVPCKFS